MPEHDFPFEEGDTVLVKVRKRSSMVAKFVGECRRIERRPRPTFSDKATIRLPFGVLNSIDLMSHQAEFEVVESHEEVNF